MARSHSVKQPGTYLDTESIADMALAKMKEQEIPANPNNFSVWYHYFANSYPDLKRTIDVLLDNKQVFDEFQCADLYERYFTMNSENSLMISASSKMGGILDQAVKFLNEAGDGAQDFGSALADATGGLNETMSNNEVRGIVKGIVEATQQMEARTRRLEVKLAESSAEVSQLHEEIKITRHEASTDGLTGLANRKLFDFAIREAAAKAMEDGDELCLLMVDIDFFKKFNDRYGHQTGDQVLKLLGSILMDSVKDDDTAARYGGEEFIIILPKTLLNDAIELADNIRQTLAKKVIVNKTSGEKLGAITLSIGVSRYDFGEPLAELINRADRALYAAKHAGRNQVLSERDLDPK